MLKFIAPPPSSLSHKEFLHSKNVLHRNIRAHSVLVTKEFTAKLWGLHGVYMRKNQGAVQREDPSMKKWQAPELLAKRIPGQSSDMWAFHQHLSTHFIHQFHCWPVNSDLFLPLTGWLTPWSSLVLPAGPLVFYCLKWRHWVSSVVVKKICNIFLLFD